MAALDTQSAALRLVCRVVDRFAIVALTVILMVVASPFFLLIPLAILLVDGRPVFYKGARLGRYKKHFMIYKFRTLIRGAEGVVGPELLSHRHKLMIPLIGKFLRDSRLDELPQLFNILKGDMSFFGPRPERPEVYESLCREIPNYELRFAVKPGIVGYSQLFTPHGAPKRLRSFIDNRVLRKNPGSSREAALVAYTVVVVLKKSLGLFAASVWRFFQQGMVLRRFTEARELTRVRPKWGTMLVDVYRNGSFALQASLIDMNDVAFRVHCPEPLSDQILRLFKLRIRLNGRNRGLRTKTAVCRGRISQTRSNGSGYVYVVIYEAATSSGRYIIEQHFLKKSLVYP